MIGPRIAVFSIVLLTGVWDAGGSAPYVAYVAHSGAVVRSGPDAAHYATAQLPLGYAVEVHRHDGDGWCAIRPPAGSFDLVPATSLRTLDGRRAEVLTSQTPVRIGGAASSPQNGVQVLLERGEIVELIEASRGDQAAVKIAPPAGEFRWIAAIDLTRNAPTEGVVTVGAPTTGEPFAHLAQLTSSSGGQAGAHANVFPSPEGWRPGLSSLRGTGDVMPAVVAQAEILRQNLVGEAMVVIPGSPAAIVLAAHDAIQATAPSLEAPLLEPPIGTPADAALRSVAAPINAPSDMATTHDGSGPPRVRFPGRGLRSTGPLDPRVAEMHLRLSQIIVQPSGEWPLAALREETGALLANETTEETRDQLRDLIDQIALFESIQNRRRDAGSSASLAAAGRGGFPATPYAEVAPGVTGQSSEILARVNGDLGRRPLDGRAPAFAGGAAPATPTAKEALYDAVGILKPVVSRKQNAPRFALVDDRGQIVSLVSPSNQVNLTPYVGQRIGVNGSRGYMSDLRRAHVTAARVTPLVR